MKFGGAMFFTEYSMAAPELAVALEERGYRQRLGAGAFAYSALAQNAVSRVAASCPSNMPTRWTRSWC